MEDSKTNERSTKMWAVKHLRGLDVVSSRNTHIRSREEDSREGSYICTRTESSISALPDAIVNGKECSMCGDVGIYKDLFQCKRCLYRYQHLYCSKSYPNFGSEKWICDWCLHTERRGPEKQQRTNLKRKPASAKGNALEFLLQVAHSTADAGNQADKVDPQRSNSIATTLPGGPVPKRQRCSHAVETGKLVALSRWRQIAKNRRQLNPSKGLGRRYKLLADVLC